MNSDEYLKASARTAATKIHPDVIDVDDFKTTMYQSIETSQWIDDFKKGLFYRKTANLDEPLFQGHMEDFEDVPHDVLHGILGTVTESGELMELLRDNFVRGFELDEIKLKDEIGDLLWYVAMLLRHYGWTFEEVFDMNIAKLRARFPDRFDEERARSKDAELEYRTIRSM